MDTNMTFRVQEPIVLTEEKILHDTDMMLDEFMEDYKRMAE